MDDTYRKLLDAGELWRTHGGLRLTMPPTASDYPHPDSTWPASQQAIEENFDGVAPATRRRILCDHAKELYGL